MINSYKRIVTFEIDDHKEKYSCIILEDEKDVILKETVIAQGHTFDSLWDYIEENKECNSEFCIAENYGIFIKGRRIELVSHSYFNNLVWTDPSSKLILNWKKSIIDKPYPITIKELSKQEVDKVIRYFNERGFKGNININ